MRAPTDDEIAAKVGISEDELEKSLSDISRSSMAALDELWTPAGRRRPGRADRHDRGHGGRRPGVLARADRAERGTRRGDRAPARAREARRHALLLRGADAARDRRGARRDRVAGLAAPHEGRAAPQGAALRRRPRDRRHVTPGLPRHFDREAPVGAPFTSMRDRRPSGRRRTTSARTTDSPAPSFVSTLARRPSSATSTFPPQSPSGEVSLGRQRRAVAPAGIDIDLPGRRPRSPRSCDSVSQRGSRATTMRHRSSRSARVRRAAGVTPRTVPAVDARLGLLLDRRARSPALAQCLGCGFRVEAVDARHGRFGGPVETTSCTCAGRFTRVPASGSVCDRMPCLDLRRRRVPSGRREAVALEQLERGRPLEPGDGRNVGVGAPLADGDEERAVLRDPLSLGRILRDDRARRARTPSTSDRRSSPSGTGRPSSLARFVTSATARLTRSRRRPAR